MTQKPTTIRELIDSYQLENPIKQCTVDQIGYAVKSLEKFVGHTVRIDELCDELVNRWLVDLENQGLAAETIKGRRKYVLQLWEYAYREGFTDKARRNVRRIKSTQKPVEAWTIDEVQRLLYVADRLPGEMKSGVRQSLYWGGLIRLAYDTAFRKGDSLRVRPEDIRENGVVKIVQQKTGYAAAAKLRDETRQIIAELPLTPGKPIFEWPYDGRWFSSHFKKIVEAAGIREGTFKWLRRTSGTQVEKLSPGEGTVQLGHKPPGIAGQHYLDISQLQDDRTQPPPLDTEGPLDEPADIPDIEVRDPADDPFFEPVRAILWKERFTGGELKVALDQLGIQYKDFAVRLDRHPKHLSTILNGRKPLALNLQHAAQLALRRLCPEAQLLRGPDRRRAHEDMVRQKVCIVFHSEEIDPEALRAALDFASIKVKKFAELLGISADHLGAMLAGRRPFTPFVWERSRKELAKLLPEIAEIAKGAS